MATNKNALIRYRTIDKCLQNRSKRWTLEDLIHECSEALYELEGKDSHVSKRTVQLDIQLMRSNKLGYNAPIAVYNKKYYTYEDEDYTITGIPLTNIDLDVLTESVEMLRQFKDFSLFNELNGVIQKLQDKIYRESSQQPAIIHIEKNENLRGLNHLDTLYQAILKQIVLKLTYQSFTSRKANVFNFTAYILKEFNNRWFVIGKKESNQGVLTLALDRIEAIDYDLNATYDTGDFNADDYYKNTYGVTVLNDEQLVDIVMRIDKHNAPYVLTKPFHHSQKVVEKHEDRSVTISIKVHLNFEIERLILGFGEAIKVIEPNQLKRRMKYKLKNALNNYTD